MHRLLKIIRIVPCVVPLLAVGSALAQSAPSAPPPAAVPGAPAPAASGMGASADTIATPPASPMPVGWGPHGKKLYYFMVFGNATPGQDAELNRWYDRIHAPIMIERGDFVWAQRFMVSPSQFTPGSPELLKRRYMVIFALETNDIDAAIKEANARLRLPRNVASRSLDYPGLTSITYEALGPAITQKEAQRRLAEETAAGNVPKPGDPPLPGSFDPFAGARRSPPSDPVRAPDTPAAPDRPHD